MTDGFLTPTLALAYVRELSVDVRAAAMLDASGEPLAGDAALAKRAGIPSGSPDAGSSIVRSEEETLVAVWAENGAAIVVSAGPHALLPLLIHDIQRVLADTV